MSRYFCHTCNARLERINSDFTCPNCSGGFVEELDESHGHDDDMAFGQGAGQFNPLDFLQFLGMDAGMQRRGGSGAGGTGAGGGGHASSPTTPGGATGLSTSSSTGSTPTTLAGAAAALAASAASPNSQSQARRPPRGHFSFVIDGQQFAGGGFGGGGAGGGGGGAGAGGATGSDNPMENMILSFIADLITGLGGGQNFPGIPLTGNINLGDYAWGREGLDAIVTQLMNNIEGTGPPPLPDEKLNALEKLQISQLQVDAKLQCSVCWEDFKVDENVIRLDCEHIYHPDCILPWLKLHGTCPVCRKDLNLGEQQQQQQQPVDSAASSTLPPNTTTTNPDSINDNIQPPSQQQQQSSSSTNTQSNPRALQDDMEFD